MDSKAKSHSATKSTRASITKRLQPSLKTLKFSYWALTVTLFLSIPAPALTALFLTSPTVSRDGITMGIVTLFYTTAALWLTAIPAVVSAIICVVNLVRSKASSDQLWRAALYLCGAPLLNLVLAVPFLLLTLMTFWSDYLWLFPIIIYTILLFWPYIVAKRERLV